ncbi:glycosyltransferase [uncultured Sphingomonas sp.]|uniref:glycosyltransferase n=1 Tax=uncultured Sphingomonas sp. TaxID=158754 RepID=UPI0035CA2808
MPAPHILHLHSAFDLGGKEARAVRLMNVWGDRARHTIVSRVPTALGARAAIARGVRYEIAQDPPPLAGKPSVKRYEAIAGFTRRFDLVLTYDWGAIDGVMARRVFGKGMPPVVHHEDGFDEDEATGLKVERNMYRRLALPAAHALVVPSRALDRIATETWKQPRARVHHIVNGVATALYTGKPDSKAIPGFVRNEREVVIGALAGLRPVKDLPLLVRACGGLSGRFRLVIVGEGPERGAIAQAAEAMGISDRLVMPGFLDRPHRYIGLFDLLALSSRSEQFPIPVVEAMAAGLPVASVPVGDVPAMLAPENVALVASHIDEVPLRDVLQKLLDAPDLRARVGAANRVRARADYDEAQMIRRYSSLYADAMGRPGILG